ncbi:hypothetical protein DFH11DRAFT_55253 [Phellopilus nigrolimitatus]|nr:hypothetical protein DFH11DRAFT_55253 [Phellopilus nigrolimitatus]
MKGTPPDTRDLQVIDLSSSDEAPGEGAKSNSPPRLRTDAQKSKTHSGEVPSEALEDSGDDTDSQLDSDVDEEDLKPLIDPSTNIKADLESVISKGFDFDGEFAYSYRYSIDDTPNPCLNITGLGPIGLPLSERDARGIMDICEKTCAELRTKGANLELLSDQVSFDNPAWEQWVQAELLSTVCAELDISDLETKKCRFERLTLHKEGSSLGRLESGMLDGKFGTVDIVLPSLFTGGRLQFLHAGKVKSYDPAHRSALSTSVVASYSGVVHTQENVQSGYCLVLSYNLLHSDDHPDHFPSIPEMLGPIRRLRHVLMSWKQGYEIDGDDWPSALACLFRHKYPKTANFGAQSLKGADALLLSHLRHVAHALRFKMFLAHIKLYVRGNVSISGRRRQCGCGYSSDWCDDDDVDVDVDKLEMDNDEVDEEVVLEKIIDVDGMPVEIPHLEIGMDNIVINIASWRDDPPDKKDFEGEEYESGTLTYMYERKAVLVWPKSANYPVVIGGAYEYTCNALRSSLSTQPSRKENKLVDSLMKCCETRHHDVATMRAAVQVLRETADRWNDPQVFLRAMRACGVDRRIDLLGKEGFISAYQAFGWENLKNLFADSVNNDLSNACRRDLVIRLCEVAKEMGDSEVEIWCYEQQEIIVRSLKLVDSKQTEWLVSLAKTRGAEDLRDVILPQIFAQKVGGVFWVEFLMVLHKEKDLVSSSSPRLIDEIISQSIAHTVQRSPPFSTKTIKSSDHHYVEQKVADVDLILQLTKLCVDTNNVEACSILFKKMEEEARRDVHNADIPLWKHYFLLTIDMDAYLNSKPELKASLHLFSGFFRMAMELIFDNQGQVGQAGYHPASSFASTTLDTEPALIIAIRRSGGLSSLRNMLTPPRIKWLACSSPDSLKKNLRLIVLALKPHEENLEAKEAFSFVISACTSALVNGFDLRTLHTRTHSGTQVNYACNDMMELVEFSLEMGTQEQYKQLLNRLLQPLEVSYGKAHLLNVLVPLIPLFRDYLKKRNIDLTTDSYAKFCATIVKQFAQKIMGQKPHEVVSVDQLKAIGCHGVCLDCQALMRFFTTNVQTISFRTAQVTRTHLERQLERTVPWGVTWTTIRQGMPHTLHVTKPESMTALGLWTGNSMKGQELLESLGNAASQQRILGNRYAWAYTTIMGKPPVSAASSAGQKRPLPPDHNPNRSSKKRKHL